MKKDYKATSLSFPKDMLVYLESLAKSEDASISSVVRKIIRNQMAADSNAK